MSCSDCQSRETICAMNIQMMFLLLLLVHSSLAFDEIFQIDSGKDVIFSCLFANEYQFNEVSSTWNHSSSSSAYWWTTIERKREKTLIDPNESNCYFEEHLRKYFDGMMP